MARLRDTSHSEQIIEESIDVHRALFCVTRGLTYVPMAAVRVLVRWCVFWAPTIMYINVNMG